MIVVEESVARADYRRFHSVTDEAYSEIVSCLVTSSKVQENWRNMTYWNFVQWASCVGGLSLGLATAKFLYNKLHTMLS